MLNNQIGSLTVYNMSLDTQRFSPGTSFKILNTLIGVQAGVIANENTSLSDSADTTKMTLKEAFSKSYTPFFQAVARKIGIDTMKSWIDRISYGNKFTSAPVDSLWLTNGLKI